MSRLNCRALPRRWPSLRGWTLAETAAVTCANARRVLPKARPMLSQGLAPVWRADAERCCSWAASPANQLAAAQYYAHPRNSFWPLVAALIQQPDLTQLPYAERLETFELPAPRGALGCGGPLRAAGQPGQRHPRGNPDPACRPGGAAAPAARDWLQWAGTRAPAGASGLAGVPVPLIAPPSSSPAMASLSFAAKRERGWRCWRLSEVEFERDDVAHVHAPAPSPRA